MDIYCRRRPTVKETTFGDLYVPGFTERFCYTLEDAIREIKGQPVHMWKVYGKTAIGAGRYLMGLVNSPKFGPDTLTLLNVPGFDVIRVHSGNSSEETQGCPLVGMKMIPDPNGDGGNITESKIALDKLKGVLIPMIRSEQVFWNVVNP